MSTTDWNRVKELFHAASERPPAERDAFLEDACAGDRALLDEVRSLLGSDPGGRSVVGQAVRDAAGTLAVASHAGTLIGPYRILREIGRGGMGAVYLAERADGQFDQKVALKLIKRGMDSDQIVGRFRRERQILARLQHPNIARLLDGGVSDDGQPYFAMEQVEGEPIDAYCDRRRLTVDQRLALFLDVCRAVSHAHAGLVVHRDLKPDNMLVTAEGHVRLLDFGIAKMVAEDEDVTQLTQAGHHVMTPAYASPEQVRGEPVGTATDIYSLGVILYELLAGVPPYDLASASLVEVARVVCGVDPERPSTRFARATGESSTTTAEAVGKARNLDVRRLRKRLAGDLDVICLKAIRKEPDERYGSVEALAEDIRRHLTGQPVLARAATLGYRLRKGVRRHRVALGAGAAVFGTVASLVTFYTVRLADERDRAQLEAAKAGEVSAFLRGLFEVSDPSQSKGETVTARELLDQGARRVQEGLAHQPEVQATMLRVIGEVYAGIGLQEEARTLLERAVELDLSLYGDAHEETAVAQAALGGVRQDLGDLDGARPLFEQSLATLRRLHGPEHPQVSDVLSLLAFWHESRGGNAEAEALFREALAQDRRFFAPDDPRVASSMVKLAGLLRRMDKFDEAEPLLRDGLATQRRAFGNKHPKVAESVRNLAALLRDKGEYAEADTLYQEALALRREMLGEVHPEVAHTLNSYAILLSRMGEVDRAIAAFREFIGLLERIYDRPHPSLAAAYSNLAFEMRDLGRFDEAITLFRQATVVQDSVLPADHPNRAFPLIGLAGVHLEQGRPAQAEPLYRRALALRRASLPPEHTQIGEAAGALGASLTALGRYAEADTLLRESHRIYVAADGADTNRTRRAARRLVALYEAWGKPEEAERYREGAAP
jgi:serine/threonine-protein kinase